MDSRLLVLGTHNRGKVRDLVDLLAGLGLPLKSLPDFPQAIVVDETGRVCTCSR